MFETELISKLKSIADKHNITLHENWSVSKNVEHLVEGLALKSPIGKVAVLVDEYDAPITNNLTESQLEWAEANMQIVQSFFRPREIHKHETTQTHCRECAYVLNAARAGLRPHSYS